VKHRATERFWQYYEALSPAVRDRADKAFELLRQNPQHPSLHFKRAGRFWSARVDLQHRALAVQEADTCIWFWIGDHDAYDRLLRKG
jgi:hypothetical protein